MSADVTRPAPRRFLAWCNNCTDGINAKTRSEAEKWATEHNTERHSGETE